MTIQKALLSAIKKLQKTCTSAHLDAEVLLSFVLNKPKGYLLSHQDKAITPAQTKKFNSLISRRNRGTPIAYLTNHKEFYKINFLVNKEVLIPRPETETLVEEAIKCVRQKQKLTRDKLDTTLYKQLNIADIGTGCGCIAITLAKYLPDIKIIATDISNKVLTVAKKNARHYKVLNKIQFIKGNLLKPIIKNKKIQLDLITANLPYLTKNELPNVRHEPPTALLGGKMGLELIEGLVSQTEKILKPNGVVLLEISPTQIKAIDYFVEKYLPNKSVFFIKDLGERDRVARIE